MVSVAFAACGGKSPTSPTDPDPSNVEAAQQVFALSGRVVLEPADTAIASATIEIVDGPNAGRRTQTDSEGRYRIDNLRGGSMTVRASAESVGSKTTMVDVDTNEVVDFMFAAGGGPSPTPAPSPNPAPPVRFAISGTIRADATSQPIAGARVELVSGADAGEQTTSDGSGRYRLGDLAEGATQIKVSAPGYSAQTKSIALAGDSTADFRLAIEGAIASGRVIDALSGGGLGGVQITGDGVVSATSSANGDFQTAVTSGSAARAVTFRGGGAVERQTYLKTPVSGVTVDLVPSSFNLGAFDEMFRNPSLRRWRTAPPLIIEQRSLQYGDVNMSSGTAVEDAMSDAEADGLVNDLAWALPQLTGDAFTQFASVTRTLSNAGATVPVLNDGSITVVRVVGLWSATGYWGFGRWRHDPDGTVTGGVVMLDRDFEKSTNIFRRSLRAHELGHALGYQHVSKTDSVMNADAQREPTSFDRAASRVAFRRPPGNHAPDVDPDTTLTPQKSGGGKWSAAIR